MSQTQPSLPRTFILNYSSAHAAPTRVRRLARIGLLVHFIAYSLLAGLCTLLAVATVLAPDSVNHLKWELFQSTSSSFLNYVLYTMIDLVVPWWINVLPPHLYYILELPTFYAGLASAAVGCCACVGWLRLGANGHRVFWTGVLPILPSLVALCGMAAICVAAAGFFGVPFFSPDDWSPWCWALLLPGAVAGFGSLVLWDLLTLVRWLARNPSEEMPARPFLPGKPRE